MQKNKTVTRFIKTVQLAIKNKNFIKKNSFTLVYTTIFF